MAVGTMIAASLFATDRMAPAAEPEVVNPDSTGFTFTDVKINKTGSVKD